METSSAFKDVILLSNFTLTWDKYTWPETATYLKDVYSRIDAMMLKKLFNNLDGFYRVQSPNAGATMLHVDYKKYNDF